MNVNKFAEKKEFWKLPEGEHEIRLLDDPMVDRDAGVYYTPYVPMQKCWLETCDLYAKNKDREELTKAVSDFVQKFRTGQL